MQRQNITSGGPFEAIFGYSRAVRLGNTIHVSGTTAIEPDGTVKSADAYDQAIKTFDVIRAALADAGATMEDVVRTRVFITNIADVDKVTKAHGETFGQIRPASTLVEVSGLMTPDLVVEIEADAILARDAT